MKKTDMLRILTNVERRIGNLQKNTVLGVMAAGDAPPHFKPINNKERLFSLKVHADEHISIASDNTHRHTSDITNTIEQPSALWIYLGDADPDGVRGFGAFVDQSGQVALCDVRSFVLIDQKQHHMTVIKDIEPLSNILKEYTDCFIKTPSDNYIHCLIQLADQLRFRITIRRKDPDMDAD